MGRDAPQRKRACQLNRKSMMPPHLLEMPHRGPFERKASPRQNMVWVTGGSFPHGLGPPPSGRSPLSSRER
jgi:hypothetical protein